MPPGATRSAGRGRSQPRQFVDQLELIQRALRCEENVGRNIDSGVVAFVQEIDEPPAPTQVAAADLEQLLIGAKAARNQIIELVCAQLQLALPRRAADGQIPVGGHIAAHDLPVEAHVITLA